MSKFDNVRKTIKRKRKRIHTTYVLIFILAIFVGFLYIQQYKVNTRSELKGQIMLDVLRIYENDKKSLDSRIKELENLNIQYNQYLDSLPFGSPVNGTIRVNSEYGWRTLGTYRHFHYGIDIKTKYRDPIIASGSGKITTANWWNGYGRCVVIEHPLGYQSLYGHLDKILVKSNQNIQKGDTIGLAGATGRADGVHLHYEIIKDKKKLDPFKYLQYYHIEPYFDTIYNDSIMYDSLRYKIFGI